MTAVDLHSLVQQAAEAHQAGRLGEAETLYRKILSAEPGNFDANHLLGIVLSQTGDLAAGIEYIQKATASNPDVPEAWSNLGNALNSAGRTEDAADAYRRTIALDPRNVQALTSLGNVLMELGQTDEAAGHYRQALVVIPDVAETLNNLGNALQDMGQYEDAEGSYRRALTISPDDANALGNLGTAQHHRKQFNEAIASFQKALSIAPDNAEVHGNLGAALQAKGLLREAESAYREAVGLDPGMAQVHSNLGIVFKDQGRFNDAIASHQQALALNPNDATFHNSLGIALKAQGRLDDAVASYNAAIALDPDNADAWGNLGSACTDIGDLDGAVAHYKKALAIRPDHPSAANNYLHILLYLPGLTNDALFKTCRQTAALGPSPAKTPAPVPAIPLASGKKLRIGYVSSDFRAHPVGHNVTQLLGNHDHERFEIFCYAQLTQPDEISEQFMRYADHWRATIGLTDAQVAERIRDDGIHIMVYLGGHFDNNRLSIATHRPAPVQVAMHGGTTTGLDEMDFWLTDAILHPPQTEELFSENLLRLPAFYNYPKDDAAPPLSTLPAENNGFITFCSFNKPCKINGTVLDLWSEVLRAVPDSRLMLKFKNHWGIPSIRQPVLDRLGANGIAPEQIILISTDDSFHDHLGHYADADIALDPFPFNGATTTYQALWMGVPVISLMGERFISRAGASISTHAGLGELVADTPEEYVQKAIALAADQPRLKELRTSLRGRVGTSPLSDGPAYASNVEKAFRDMWASHHSTP